jgi:hypothetical protein
MCFEMDLGKTKANPVSEHVEVAWGMISLPIVSTGYFYDKRLGLSIRDVGIL